MQSLPAELFQLNNSIYRNKSADYFQPAEMPVEDEGAAIVINHTPHKPIHFTHNQPATQLSLPYQPNCCTLSNSRPHQTIKTPNKPPGEPGTAEIHRQSTRIPIVRLCQSHLAGPLQEMQACQPILSDKWRRRRDCLAARSRCRKEEMFGRMRQATYEQMLYEEQEDQESMIQQELNFEECELKECRIHQFLTRQKFFDQEKQIMRQMREFCLYGSIRVEQQT